MKKLFVPLSMFLLAAILFFACSGKTFNEQDVRRMLENAVFSPEQAFGKYKTFYMRTERIIDEDVSAGEYIGALDKESYNANSLFENKIVQELYVQDNKLRLSSYVESISSPLELHIIYDGETLWSVSNFANKDGMKVTFEQAKAFISFPQSDFFKRIRADFEQSGGQIQYKHAGTQKYNGYKCDIVEMSLKEAPERKAVFFIDRKTNVAVKTAWSGLFSNDYQVRRISKSGGERIPSVVEIAYGKYFTAIIKYSVKIDEYLHPDIFKEENILLPVRGMYKEKRFQNEKPDRTRARIRVVLDSIQSFDVVLNNMHIADFSGDFGSGFDSGIKAIELPVLEKRFIPDNAFDYRIPLAADVSAKEEKIRKEEAAKAKPKAKEKTKAKTAEASKKEEAVKAADVKDKNDETDWLEYNPRDVYQSIEAELEEMKDNDPEEYEKMKKIIEEMKQKDERVKSIAN